MNPPLASVNDQASTGLSRGLSPVTRWPLHTLRGADGLRVELLAGGVVRGIWAGDLLVSRLLGTLGGGMMRLYLRRRRDGRVVDVCEAVGPASRAACTAEAAAAHWRGTWADSSGAATPTKPWTYQITLTLDPNSPRWAWHVRIDGAAPDDWDAVLVQDIALAGEGTVRNNEKYVSQYLDHRIEQHADAGRVLMSRQALPQQQRSHPWLLSLATRGAAVMTDGVAFFGPRHKADGQAEHLFDAQLPNGVTQHETAAAVLQATPEIRNNQAGSSVSFGFAFVADHPAASGTDDLKHVTPLLAWLNEPATAPTADPDTEESSAPSPADAPLRSGDAATDADLQMWFGPRDTWRQVECEGDATQSFFHGPDRHVATLHKDAALRRGHGHILRTGRAWMPEAHTVGMTCYQHGVFASQITLGNTTFGQITGVARDAINLDRLAGLRLSVDLGAGYEQLAVATAYEMAPGWCRWWYRLGDRVLTVRAAASPDAPLLRFELRVTRGGPVRVRFTQHVCMGEKEDGFTTEVVFDAEAGTCTGTPAGDTRLAQTYPESRFVLAFDQPETLTTLDALSTETNPDDQPSPCYPYVIAETGETDTLGWSITAATTAQGLPDTPPPDADTCAQAADDYWAQLSAPLTRRLDAQRNGGLAPLADIAPWFVHNAMIHLSLPHGLEQFGGAAWGTRDVCQGPVEMLRAIDRPDVIADILRVVFRHQHRQTGNWPQWFMHPPFSSIQAGESHGDVVVWPLYALCHYLEMTGDTSLLNETVGYTEADRAAGFPFSGDQHAQTVRRHVDLALSRIASQYIPGTVLPRYGDGDWNDSLQPAEPWMADRMVSSWTIALLQHTLSRLAEAVETYDADWSNELKKLAQDVADDFHRWCVVDGQVAGIVLFNEAFTAAEPLLHPQDQRTGIHHSLIPMNRGLLAGLYDESQAQHHLDVIEKHLAAPDGTRLMERPPAYAGGISTFFQRAESAAFFGREIGLMYTHAHLRYAEVLIQRGDLDQAVVALNVVNPVALRDRVPNATPRQANAYFSSSDAGFSSRHDAGANHDKVFRGEIPAHGGWRIYSSGPGIFLWLISRCLTAPPTSG